MWPALPLRFLCTPSVFLRLRGVKKTTERSSSSSLLFSGAPFHKCLRSVSSFAVRAVTAVTSLRTVQLNALLSKAGAKLLLFFDMTKYFCEKMTEKCTFCAFLTIFRGRNSDFPEWTAHFRSFLPSEIVKSPVLVQSLSNACPVLVRKKGTPIYTLLNMRARAWKMKGLLGEYVIISHIVQVWCVNNVWIMRLSCVNRARICVRRRRWRRSCRLPLPNDASMWLICRWMRHGLGNGNGKIIF